MKGRWVKWSVAAAALIVVLLLAAVVAVHFLLTPERVRSLVVPVAEQQLHRRVELGAIDISLFSGVTVADFGVRQKDDKGDFAAADQLVLRYRFWPLLRGQVAIDEIRLVHPRIRIERYADGRWNFSDLLPAADTAKTDTASSPAGAAGVGLAGFSLHRAVVEGGDLQLVDHLPDPAHPVRLALERVQLDVRDLTADHPFPVNASLQLGPGRLEFDGTVDPVRRGGKGKLALMGLDFHPLFPYLQPLLPGTLKAAQLDATVEVEGTSEQLSSHGHVNLHGVDLLLNALPQAPFIGARLDTNYAVELNRPAGQLKVKQLALNYNDVPLRLAGEVDGLNAATPRLQLQLEGNGLKPSQLLAALPPQLVEPARPLAPTGEFDLRLVLAGPVDQPLQLLQQGQVVLRQVAVQVAGYQPSVDGTIRLQQHRASTDGLVAAVAEQRAALALTLDDITQLPLKGHARLSADRIDLDRIMAAAPATNKPSAAASGPAAKPRELGPYDIPLDLKGDIAIGQVLAKGVEMKQLAAHFSLVRNVLTLDPITAEVAKGRIQGKSRVDLGQKGLAYTSSLKVERIAIEKLVPGLWPRLAGAIVGRLSLDLAGEGRGTMPATLRKNLQGKGELQLFQSRLSSSALTQGLADATRLQELQQLNFDNVALNFLINKGSIHLTGKAEGDETRLSPAGDIGLDGALDMNLGLQLAPDLAKKYAGESKVGQLLTNAKGWGQLPVKLAGSVSDPKVVLDSAALRKQLQEKGKQQLQQKLQEKLFGKPPASSGPSESAPATKPEPGKKLLEEGLKHLLGK